MSFTAHADAWWQPEGPLRTLHDINPTRVDYIARTCGGVRGKRILDIGCGGGILCEALAARGATVTGIDIDEALIRVATEHASTNGHDIRYQCIAAPEFAATQERSFDIVCCLELLEHVPDPTAIIAAAATVCSADGHVVFSTINRTLPAFVGAIVIGEYLSGLIPRGTHQYADFIRPAELDRACREHRLQLRDLSGLSYHPFTRNARISNSVTMNYIATYNAR